MIGNVWGWIAGSRGLSVEVGGRSERERVLFALANDVLRNTQPRSEILHTYPSSVWLKTDTPSFFQPWGKQREASMAKRTIQRPRNLDSPRQRAAWPLKSAGLGKTRMNSTRRLCGRLQLFHEPEHASKICLSHLTASQMRV